MKRQLFFVMIVVLVGLSNALAFDFLRSEGNGMGQTVLLSHSLPSTLVNVPSGGIMNGEWRLETGFDRQYDMSDLDQFFAAGAFRRRHLTAALGVSKFGKSDLYSELTTKLAVAWHFDSLAVGVNISNLLLQFGGDYGNLSGTTVGGSVSYKMKRLFAALVADNLTSPRLDHNAREVNPRYYIYAEFEGKQSFALTGRVTVERDQDAQFGLGQMIFVGGNSAIFWGISTSPLEYGAGVELGIKGSTIAYAFSNHPVLGFSQTFSVSVGSGHTRRRTNHEFE